MLKHPNSDQPKFLTTKEVADLLRVKERKVYDLAAADEIPHRRITGKLLFPADELNAWLEGTALPSSESLPAILVGSHDPLLDWAIHASDCGLAVLCNGSGDGLKRFQEGGAALAGLHLPEEDGWNIDTVRRSGVRDAVLLAFATRKRGLLMSPEASAEIRSVADLKGKRVALRQPGAGAALLFARLLEEAGLTETDLVCAQSPAHSENDAAVAVAAGEADAALGIEAMANPFKLRFLPLVDERFDLLVNRRAYFTEPLQKLLAFARTPSFQDKADALGGYDLSTHGSVRWLST